MEEATSEPYDEDPYALTPPPGAGDMRLVRLPAHIPEDGSWGAGVVAVTNEMSVNEEFRKAVAKFLS